MLKKKKKDLEFEKSKKEFLQYMKDNGSQEVYPKKHDYYDSSGAVDYSSFNLASANKKTAYEYELEMYRKSKSMNLLHTIGAICGILAFTIVLYFRGGEIIKIVKDFLPF